MRAATQRVDVLVIGLGPAGASAARAAAANGARVLALDRRRHVGVPVQCTELVPAMIGQDKDVLAASWRQAVEVMTTFVENDAPHVRDRFPGHMIDRAAFDAALVARAGEAGAICETGVVVRSLAPDGRACLSDGREIAAGCIVGADGPHSIAGRAIGHVNVEIAETRQVALPLRQPSTSTDIFLSAAIPGGYGWLFPRGDRANLGVGVAPRWRHRLKPLLDGLHARLVADGRTVPEPIGYTGGAIPVGGLVGPAGALGDTAVLLAGDAAGLSNPVTGAGINAAVQSGALAGIAAARIAAGERQAADDFAEEMCDTFGPSLARALARRRALLAAYGEGGAPGPGDLRRGWIAFPEYWAA